MVLFFTFTPTFIPTFICIKIIPSGILIDALNYVVSICCPVADPGGGGGGASPLKLVNDIHNFVHSLVSIYVLCCTDDTVRAI